MAMKVDRRSFLRQSIGSAALASTASWTAASYAQVIGANERIRVGLIGAGGMGSNHAQCLSDLRKPDNIEVVAAADCWLTRAKQAAQTMECASRLSGLPPCAGQRHRLRNDSHTRTLAQRDDLRRAGRGQGGLLRKADDAHYRGGPRGGEEAEGNRAPRTNRRPGYVGRHLSPSWKSGARWCVRKGRAGTDRVRSTVQPSRPLRDPGPVDKYRQKPADLDWKAWLGNAPECDWNPHHYFEWRCYSPYSGGIATDLFIHRITRLMIACDLQFPRRVVGMGGIWQWPDGRDLPDNFEMICEYPRGMTVYVLGTQSNRVGVDHLIRGYRATLQFVGNKWVAKDKGGKQLAEESGDVQESIYKHHTNFHHHLRNGEPLNCPISLALPGLAAVCMANESWRTGQMMAWDKEYQRMIPAHELKEQDYFPEDQGKAKA